MAYDMSYFRPVDETVRGPGLPSSQEVRIKSFLKIFELLVRMKIFELLVL